MLKASIQPVIDRLGGGAGEVVQSVLQHLLEKPDVLALLENSGLGHREVDGVGLLAGQPGWSGAFWLPGETDSVSENSETKIGWFLRNNTKG